MILAYGNYRHSIAETAISMASDSRFNNGGQILSLVTKWVIKGMLLPQITGNHSADLAAMGAAINALEAAYSIQNQDAILYLDDGVTKTAHQILAKNCIGGTRVYSNPDYPVGEGAEYGGLYRTYVITIEGDVLITPGSPSLVDYHETLSFSGGGPSFKVLQPLNGPPIKQVVADFTPYRATQTGRLVGWLQVVPPNQPIWPYAEHTEQRQVTQGVPKRTGPGGSESYTEFESTWSYHFEDPLPLIGQSQYWKGN